MSIGRVPPYEIWSPLSVRACPVLDTGERVRVRVGGTASAFGAQIRFLALPLTAILVLDATPLQLGILAAVGSAPALILGLAVGIWVDRRRKRPVMVVASLAGQS